MREIKFRLWDSESRKMWDWGYLEDIAYETDFEESFGNDFRKYEVMQFTGLKDRNGKEIYEGDIIEIKWGNAVERNIVKYDVGKFSSGFLFFKGASDDTSGYNMLWGIEDSEIIGNIYENPELLSKLNN